MNSCRFPEEERPFFHRFAWLAGLLLILGLGLFGATTYSLVTHRLLYPEDQVVSNQLSLVRSAMPGGEKTALTWFANLASILPNLICLVFAYYWLRKKCDDRFTLILSSYAVGLLLFWLFALIFNRPRPDLPGLLKSLPFPSYPSGHMIQTITLLAPLLYLYLPNLRSHRVRLVIILLAVFYLVLVGYDRLILNAHYLTDVLGGVGLGLFWATFVLVSFELYHLRIRRTYRTRAYAD